MLKNYLSKNVLRVNKIAFILILIYSLMLLLPWISKPTFLFSRLWSNSLVNSAFRIFAFLLLGAAIILLLLANRVRVPWNVWILAGLFSLYFIVLAIVCDKEMMVQFFTNGNTEVVSYIDLGVLDVVKYYVELVASLFLVIAYWFIFPSAFALKSIRVFLFFWIGIGLLSILYSVVFERSVFPHLLSGFSEKYQNYLASFYQSKNAFGIVLFISFACSGLASTIFTTKKTKFLLYFLCFLFLLFTFFSRCDSALFSELFCVFCFIIFKILKLSKGKKWGGITLWTSVVLLGIGGLFFFYCAANDSSFLGKKLPFSLASITARMNIWSTYLSHIGGWETFLGFGPVGPYLRMFSDPKDFTTLPLHNGFLDIYNAGGFPALILYLFLLSSGFSRLFKMWKQNYSDSFGFLLSFSFCFLLYSFFETSRFGLDLTTFSFVPSLMFLCFPKALLKGENHG